jgi:hypothetical protein
MGNAPLAGFEDIASIAPIVGGGGGRITGSGCLDPNGFNFTYHYTYHNAVPLRFASEWYFETGVCSFETKHVPTENAGSSFQPSVAMSR